MEVQETNGASSLVPITVLTAEEEDVVIHNRLLNDERSLKKVVKKFHNFTSASYQSAMTASTTPPNDARESFLLELASFRLALQRSMMVCEAEARQVEEYQREKQRIVDEHDKLRDQIEHLKSSLEHAQVRRRHKMEYDKVAERINAFPTRKELEQSTESLQSDMVMIRGEQETHDTLIRDQQTALDEIISRIAVARSMGKEEGTSSAMASPESTPVPDGAVEPVEKIDDATAMDTTVENVESPLIPSTAEPSTSPPISRAITPASALNPTARIFEPSVTKFASPLRQVTSAAPAAAAPLSEDIEMGELEEEPRVRKGKNKVREDREEGEASDDGSEVSDPPSD